MKTNKSLTKRLTVTKNGKVKARKPGLGHFNSKMSRSKQLGQRAARDFVIKPKTKARFMPFSN